jgi:L-2-hydroxyglutarate oxidase LhgO
MTELGKMLCPRDQMTDDIDTVIVGAGVVGLAVARAFSLAGKSVVVLENEDKIGCHTSSRNSEVIHAAIYYSPSSLKARLCPAGNRLVYEYCRVRNIEHRRCGKLIVATSPAELAELEAIHANAIANGVDDLAYLDMPAVAALEPELVGAGALLSPSTGIIDSHGFMLALQGDAEDHGAVIAFRTRFVSASVECDGFLVRTGGSDPTVIKARKLVNAAGLWSPSVAHLIEGLSPETISTAYYARGNYFSLVGRCPFSHLIYPVPEPGGLGVHATLDLAGQVRFGPDVEWIDGISYDVDPRRSGSFYAAIRKYWPRLKDCALMPAYSGIRPKIVGPTEPASDFCISGPGEHGVPGLINLFGIESPGLTSSLALADEVVARLSEPGRCSWSG